ncbi:YpjP family protein [Metabacillus sp. GX 13764]|uniref:YpjP family protein n=1 Tax=Metabacillus kandeliae TaxID=2900151 RepID=UPI001E396B47|nr:YpjP family protein [Metabacillus kandeliae]MCD7033455.1 YpjP family protein [Metabacillus kandeliae]
MSAQLRKMLVILFSIFTLGLVAPPQALLAKEAHTEHSSVIQEDDASFRESEYEWTEEDLHRLYRQADEQSYLKFGGKVGPVIDAEFRAIILPKIEEAIEETLLSANKTNIAISKKPGKGKSEKIFHIYDTETGEDMIRFHVRIDHPPKNGYWFNFHYHTENDGFQAHHELGSIYWDKNTPPGWMNGGQMLQ